MSIIDIIFFLLIIFLLFIYFYVSKYRMIENINIEKEKEKEREREKEKAMENDSEKDELKKYYECNKYKDLYEDLPWESEKDNEEDKCLDNDQIVSSSDIRRRSKFIIF
jgi:hypothetical protein